MPVIVQDTLGREGQCENCETPIEPEDLIFVLWGKVYCSLACIEEALNAIEQESGADFTATQDQALASVTEQLGQRPAEFVFIYKPTDPEDGDVGITMFCPPGFILACIEALARATVESQPYIEPPPE